MPGERKWLDLASGGSTANVLRQSTGNLFTMNFTVDAGEIPAGGASFRGARVRTVSPGNSQVGRFCLYSGFGDGVPLLTYGDFQQKSGDIFAVYTALFVDAIPVAAGNYQLMICAPFGAANQLEVCGRNGAVTIGRLLSTGGVFDPPMNPLSATGNSPTILNMEVFALCAPPLPDLIFGGRA